MEEKNCKISDAEWRIMKVVWEESPLNTTKIINTNEMTFNFKPLLRIGMFQFEGLVKAFVDYANENKIHTEAEETIKGKLDAKEAHLADMQEMSKKLLDAIIKIKQP